jgi:hypothetical protein
MQEAVVVGGGAPSRLRTTVEQQCRSPPATGLAPRPCLERKILPLDSCHSPLDICVHWPFAYGNATGLGPGFEVFTPDGAVTLTTERWEFSATDGVTENALGSASGSSRLDEWEHGLGIGKVFTGELLC